MKPNTNATKALAHSPFHLAIAAMEIKEPAWLQLCVIDVVEGTDDRRGAQPLTAYQVARLHPEYRDGHIYAES